MLARLLRPVALAGALAGAIVLAPSCRPEGQSGVHVVVRLDPAAWQQAGAFDHLTLTARGGGARGVACFFPVSGALRAVEPLSDADTAPDPCADLDEVGWAEVPTLATWDLETTPRTANFVFPGGTEVEVEVVAGLGGEPGIGGAKGRAVASDAFPTVTLDLVPATPGPACFAPLTRTVPEQMLIDYLGDRCKMPTEPCLSTPETPGRSEATSCGADGTVYFDNRATTGTCPDPTLVFSTGAISVSPCAKLYMVGHFARCRPSDPRPLGECELTTDCDVPQTVFTVRTARGPDVVADLSCLPPLLTPVAVPVLRFPAALRGATFVTQAPNTSGRACALIIKQLALGSAACKGR